VRALPALAANTIQSLASARHGLRVGIIAILHTFNGRLDFNAHVHTMATAGGLEASGRWSWNVTTNKTLLWSAGAKLS
jgi:hypothetical protein